MKAILYRLPARNLLVLTAADGTVELQYPPSEVRGHHMAQDAGANHLEFGRMEDVFKSTYAKKK